MTRDALAACVTSAGIACQVEARLLDVDERMGGVLVGTPSDPDSVQAWLDRFGLLGISWRVVSVEPAKGKE